MCIWRFEDFENASGGLAGARRPRKDVIKHTKSPHMEEPRAVLEADMFNTTAYGKEVVKYIQSVEYFWFL